MKIIFGFVFAAWQVVAIAQYKTQRMTRMFRIMDRMNGFSKSLDRTILETHSANWDHGGIINAELPALASGGEHEAVAICRGLSIECGLPLTCRFGLQESFDEAWFRLFEITDDVSVAYVHVVSAESAGRR